MICTDEYVIIYHIQLFIITHSRSKNNNPAMNVKKWNYSLHTGLVF